MPVLIALFISCSPQNNNDTACFEEAKKNGLLVNEGYNRCLRYVHDWLEYADPVSGLIPENLEKGRDIWSPHNSAADNYAFMVLTSCLLDKDLFEGRMKNMLKAEKELTSRLGALPASYSFSKQDFLAEELDTSAIIFGSSEYIKDGLIPLTEYMGRSPWTERMIDMLDDLSEHMRIAREIRGAYFGNAVDHEINGELLQTLSRVYWMTNDRKYLDWAIDIGDYYLVEYPDLLLKNKRLRLRDHGCEVIGGLSELFVALHYTMPAKKETYREVLFRILDRILEVGRNEDGMFYNEVNMITGEVVDSTIVDNWGYIYNAYYSIFLVDGRTSYRDAVVESFTMLNRKYRNFNWEAGSSDGFADAIESGINLYNREPDTGLGEWLDSEITVMWSIQDTKLENSGIIEGWHGDGNFARTTIMYCLWKTNGVTVQPVPGVVYDF